MNLKTLALFLFIPVALSAAEPTPKIPASFYAFNYVPGHESVSIRTGPEGFEELRLSKANIVGPVNAVTVEGTLMIHSKPVSVEGKTTHPVIGSVKIPADLRRALVVLFPEANNPATPYRCILLNHDLNDFPLGAYRMINVSPHPVRGSVARQYVEAKPGGMADLEPMGEPGAIVPVRFEFFDNGRWNLLTETRAAIRKDRRWLTCVYQDPVTGRMNIRSIPDRTNGVSAATNQDASSD
ncbi:MAG: hypothetical protein MUF13_00290 [Akkermansiaceae bacterium]|jgi:hypothetical protein|nr:hypothetical protein [Akkermansiaceae bacterium]